MFMSNVGRGKLINTRWNDLIVDKDVNLAASSLIEAMVILYENVVVAMFSVRNLI